MQLNCKTCAAPLKAENFHLENCLGKCEYCNTVSYFGQEMSPQRSSAEQYNDRWTTREKDAIGRHARFDVQQQAGELVVRYRWFTWGILFLAFFCAVWDGFLVVWYTIGITSGAPWMMLVFPLLHVAVGVAITYVTICCFVNSTEIHVTPGEVRIDHGPLPCGRSVQLATESLSQLFCKEEVRRTKNGTSYKYLIMAHLRTGGAKKLLTGFDDPEQAVYLERLIEKHLGIDDHFVGGELRWEH